MTPLLKQQIVGQHVHRLRVEAGISLRTLARQTDFSPSFVSLLENGQVSPSIRSMEKIASALGVTLGQFFAATGGGEGGLIVRAADRTALSSGWSQAEIESLSLARPTARLEATLVTLRAGGRSRSAAVNTKGRRYWALASSAPTRLSSWRIPLRCKA